MKKNCVNYPVALDNLKEYVLLCKSEKKADLLQVFEYTTGYTKNDFYFLILLTGDGIYQNLQTGNDCNTLAICSNHTGYLYLDISEGHGAINIQNTRLTIGAGNTDNQFSTRGFALYGYMKK